MSYAKRVPLTCSMRIDFGEDTKLLGQHVITTANSAPRVVRKKLSKEETAATLAVLPPVLRRHCLGVSKNSIAPLGPHVHTQELCTINFYYRTGGEETVFYAGEYVQDDSAALDNGNGYYMVKPDLLSPALSYTAKDGDVWVLNTKKAHAVFGGDGHTPREILQVYMKISYEDVITQLTRQNADN